MQKYAGLDIYQWVILASFSIAIAVLIIMIGWEVLSKITKNNDEPILKSKASIIWTIAGALLVIGVSVILTLPIDAIGNIDFLWTNAGGAICVVLGAGAQLISGALFQRNKSGHEAWHDGGLILLAIGGVLLAMDPVFKIVL